MKRMLFIAFALGIVSFFLAEDASAHGGSFRGPNGGVPPGHVRPGNRARVPARQAELYREMPSRRCSGAHSSLHGGFLSWIKGAPGRHATLAPCVRHQGVDP